MQPVGADRRHQNKPESTGSTQIDGLTPNTEYAFQVAAVNFNGTGPFRDPSYWEVTDVLPSYLILQLWGTSLVPMWSGYEASGVHVDSDKYNTLIMYHFLH